MRAYLAGNGGFLPILHLLNLYLDSPLRRAPLQGDSAQISPQGDPIAAGVEGPLRRPSQKFHIRRISVLLKKVRVQRGRRRANAAIEKNKNPRCWDVRFAPNSGHSDRDSVSAPHQCLLLGAKRTSQQRGFFIFLYCRACPFPSASALFKKHRNPPKSKFFARTAQWALHPGCDGVPLR